MIWLSTCFEWLFIIIIIMIIFNHRVVFVVCCNCVRRQLWSHGNVNKAAKELVNAAMLKGSGDNISVLVCCLNQH